MAAGRVAHPHMDDIAGALNASVRRYIQKYGSGISDQSICCRTHSKHRISASPCLRRDTGTLLERLTRIRISIHTLRKRPQNPRKSRLRRRLTIQLLRPTGMRRLHVQLTAVIRMDLAATDTTNTASRPNIYSASPSAAMLATLAKRKPSSISPAGSANATATTAHCRRS